MQNTEGGYRQNKIDTQYATAEYAANYAEILKGQPVRMTDCPTSTVLDTFRVWIIETIFLSGLV